MGSFSFAVPSVECKRVAKYFINLQPQRFQICFWVAKEFSVSLFLETPVPNGIGIHDYG